MTCVYVIAAEGTTIPCKIGVAINPARRAVDLSCGSSKPLRVVGSVRLPDRREAERVELAMHRLLKHYPPLHLHREWFDIEASDALEILSDIPDLLASAQQLKEAR